MAALTKERDTSRRDGDRSALGVAAATLIHAGSIVCRNAAGFATKGAVATTLVALGMAERTTDNAAGANGDQAVPFRRDGWFRFGNSAAGDAITAADIGADCYIVDDQTVAKTDGTGTRSVAGKVRDVDASGVWISFN